MKQSWHFYHEDRTEFLLERFGFAHTAQLSLHVKDVTFEFASDSQRKPENEIRAGLLFIHETELWETMSSIQNGDSDTTSASISSCLLENQTHALWLDFTKPNTWNIHKTIGIESDNKVSPSPGFYYIFYTQCTDGLEISFSMEAEFRNPNNNYLSAGDAPLPTVYLFISLAFMTSTIVWIRFLCHHRHQIHHVHHMMTVLVVCKTISLFAESMRYYYMKQHGDTLTTWTAVYYIFMFLKGMMLFIVLLLIGMGWSLLKGHLSRREQSIISIVLVLQVLSNTAMIVMEESAVGTQSWKRWRDVLHLMDFLCCCAIMFPIVWSIRTLRESATTDGKAHINLHKLTQFRSFYMLVVTYIYVTRIALYLLTASLPYNATWLSVCVGEGASLIFFLLTGYRFCPADANPYATLSMTDRLPIHALDEFGLEEEDHDVFIQRQDHLRFGNVLRPPSPRKTTRMVV